MSDWELVSTGLVAVTGSWTFLRLLGKNKHRRERILDVLHRRAMRDARAQQMLEESPDERGRPAPDGNGQTDPIVVGPPGQSHLNHTAGGEGDK